jgi:murein DD-endopeptidase MepM/ murein hydrolase activator NlpD
MKQLLSIFLVGLVGNATAQKMRQPAVAISANMGKAKHTKAAAEKPGKLNALKPVAAVRNKHIPRAVDKIKHTPSKVVHKSKRNKFDSLASAMQAQLQWPFAGCHIAEPFGHIDMGTYTIYNPGITLSSPAPVMANACYDAVVENIVLIEGKYAVLTSYNGLYLGYSHLDEVVVKKGDQLKKGAAIGTLALDETGSYSLLLLLQLNNKERDPYPWFESTGSWAVVR